MAVEFVALIPTLENPPEAYPGPHPKFEETRGFGFDDSGVVEGKA